MDLFSPGKVPGLKIGGRPETERSWTIRSSTAIGEIALLPARKAGSLPTCIALGPAAHSRDHFINFLWSDRWEQPVRNSLRQALSAFKKLFDAFGAQPLQIERMTVFLANQSIDTDAVRQEDRVAERTPQAVTEAMADATAASNFVYSGYRYTIIGVRLRLAGCKIGSTLS